MNNYKEKENSFKEKLFSGKFNGSDSKNMINQKRIHNAVKLVKQSKSIDNESNELDLNESMDERVNELYNNKKAEEEINSGFDDEVNSDNASFTSNEDLDIDDDSENSDENIVSENQSESSQAQLKHTKAKKGIESKMESLNKAMKKTLNEIDLEESENGNEDLEEEENDFEAEQSDNNEEWESVSNTNEENENNEMEIEVEEIEEKDSDKVLNYEGFDDENEPSDEDEEKIKNNNEPNNNLNYMDALQPAYDDLDDEIKKLEKKLGITKKDKYNRLKKKVASENFDEDLFDFLDEIDHYVQDKKTGKTQNIKSNKNVKLSNSKTNETKNKASTNRNKIAKELEEFESEISVKKESLEELKSKSKLFSKTKISEEQILKNQLNKDIIAILNRISEGNLSILVKDFIAKLDNFEIEFAKISNRKNAIISIYEVITRNCLKSIADQIITNITISSCIATYVSILHFKYGNSFMLYFIKTLTENFNNNFDLLNKDPNSGNKAELKNLIFLLIQFFLYGNLTARLYYDLIKRFIDNFNDTSSELLLLLLNYLGIELRKEDPESLKEIFRKVNTVYNSSVAQNKLIKDELLNNNTNNKIDNAVINPNIPQSNSNKIKYIVEMIEEIKNNKFMKFNMNEKFNFFKNFVNNSKKDYTQENYNLNSEKIADKIDLGLDSLKNFDKTKLQDYIEEGNETNLKINDFVLENIDDIEIDDNIFCNNKVLEAKMQKLKLTTDLKKKIFKAIVGATDFIDAYERLNRLNLKKDQAREIIKIIVLLVGSEKKYNQFYKMLLEKLMEFEKDHKYTYHYTIWDNMRIMNTFKD